jgi:hypothetical protein
MQILFSRPFGTLQLHMLDALPLVMHQTYLILYFKDWFLLIPVPWRAKVQEDMLD